MALSDSPFSPSFDLRNDQPFPWDDDWSFTTSPTRPRPLTEVLSNNVISQIVAMENIPSSGSDSDSTQSVEEGICFLTIT